MATLLIALQIDSIIKIRRKLEKEYNALSILFEKSGNAKTQERLCILECAVEMLKDAEKELSSYS